MATPLLLAFSFAFALAVAQLPPAELYSPLIQEKVLTIAQTEPQPVTYPQYTDTVLGDWLYFPPDTWTSGFLPAMLYELNVRATLCHQNDSTDWVGLGRQWSTAEIPLEQNNTVGHDVGFLSYPFVSELAMYGLSAFNLVLY
jgi:hypothetical protein